MLQVAVGSGRLLTGKSQLLGPAQRHPGRLAAVERLVAADGRVPGVLGPRGPDPAAGPLA
jgi:hypothetical protein